MQIQTKLQIGLTLALFKLKHFNPIVFINFFLGAIFGVLQ